MRTAFRVVAAAAVFSSATFAASADDNRVLLLGAASAGVSAGFASALTTPIQTGELTVEFWLRLEEGPFGRPFNMRGCSCGGLTVQANVEGNLGQLDVELGAAGSGGFATLRGATFALSQWQHFAVVWSRPQGSLLIYRNGTLTDQMAVPTDASFTYCGQSPIRFGSQCGRGLSGAMDNVRYWAVARTNEQIQSDMTRQYTPSQAQAMEGLLGSWTFEDGTVSNGTEITQPGTLEGAASIVQEVVPPLGQFPIQWRVEDGGNGHWYQLKIVTEGVTWHEAQLLATGSGAHLAACESQSEREFINQTFSPENSAAGWFQQGGGSGPCPLFGPWIGGIQDTAAPTYSEPYGGWRWVTGAHFSPQDIFCCNNSCFGQSEEHLQLYRGCGASAVSWNDLRDDPLGCGGRPIGYVAEWSADCNNDGIVDYGQILNGQLVDANSNGVPDTCEAPPCPADLSGNGVVNGVDLAAVLSSWGTNGESELNADINRDGIVDGQDLAYVLSGWGPCP